MTVTLLGDFADPLSFLASQRIEQLTSLGLLDVTWTAVDARRQPAADLTGLSLPGEVVPVGTVVAGSGAATSAYAEVFATGALDAMRRALFDAAWIHHRRIADPEVIRSVAFEVLNPEREQVPIKDRIRANRLLVPEGRLDPIGMSRRLGLLVSLAGGPLSTAGQRHLDAWRRLWERYERPALPLLMTDGGEVAAGESALRWLADRLPGRAPSVAPGAGVPAAAPRVDRAAATG